MHACVYVIYTYICPLFQFQMEGHALKKSYIGTVTAMQSSPPAPDQSLGFNFCAICVVFVSVSKHVVSCSNKVIRY